MKVPKLVYVLLLAAGSALFPVLPDLLSLGNLAGPVLLGLAGLVVRLLDSIDPRVHTMVRGDAPGFLRRFFTE